MEIQNNLPLQIWLPIAIAYLKKKFWMESNSKIKKKKTLIYFIKIFRYLWKNFRIESNQKFEEEEEKEEA